MGGDAAFYWDNFSPEYMKNEVLSQLNYYNLNKSALELKIKERAAFFDWNKAAREYLKLYTI